MTQADKRRVELDLFRRLVPIGELTQENFRELAGKSYVEQLPAGRTLFRKGDKDNLSYYLLSGEVRLNDGNESRSIHGGTAKARFPLDHHRPHLATATAVTPIEFVRVDNDLLDILLTWDQNSGYVVSEIDENRPDDNHWMTNLLRSSLFTRIPPANIQGMFLRFEPVRVKAGEVVIRQGAEGDYYYYMHQGRAVVTRASSRTEQPLRLAELAPGSSFGEEALISGGARNATVQMLSDGLLMRLSKRDFDTLLKEPVVRTVDYRQAGQMVRDGAVWLDVRAESEHKNDALPGSLNLPLYLLRLKSASLPKTRPLIAYCDTGRRSACAAYLLSERGFEVFVLKGGLIGRSNAA